MFCVHNCVIKISNEKVGGEANQRIATMYL